MYMIVIDAATLVDREALCRLYYEFHEFHVLGVPDRLLSLGQPPQTHAASELYHAVSKVIKGADSAILIAKINDQPIGLAEIYIKQEEPNPLRTAYRYGHLQSLLVTAACRGQGVGAKLLEAAQQWAKDRGAAEMRLETWEFDEGPLPFYEKNHYQTLRRTLVRTL
ncbi:MAG: GNAT family N-acetyltransferase [Ardenticatenaceae bacterium]|nr:GNAT family N-acetyltransferase [Ardenticatenaceae bacterium]